MRTHFRRFAVPSPRAFSKLRRRANEIPLRRNGSSSGQAQHGAAAIEFALLFIIFFAIFYGIVSYALPMLMIQAFHHAAAAGARAGVAVDPKAFPGDPVGCTQKVETVVRTEV
ncbi:MAG: TadE/TadG family type IV pilus assembly protein, partial [Methylococcales bacterium]